MVQRATLSILSRSNPASVSIGSGSENIAALEKRAVVRMVTHPKHDDRKKDYDAGVVKVATPFVVSAVHKPIALVAAGEDATAGEPVVVTGWGDTLVSLNSKFFTILSKQDSCDPR